MNAPHEPGRKRMGHGFSPIWPRTWPQLISQESERWYWSNCADGSTESFCISFNRPLGTRCYRLECVQSASDRLPPKCLLET